MLQEDASPRITHTLSQGALRVLAEGRWTAAWLARPAHWEALNSMLETLPSSPTASHVTPSTSVPIASGAPEPATAPGEWDLRNIQRLDHTGAQMLWNAWRHRWPQSLQADASQRAMLQRVAQYTVESPPDRPKDYWQEFLNLGRHVMSALEHLRDITRLVGQLVLDLRQLLRAPRAGPWRDVTGHLYHVGATALPITALVGFLIGVVLAYLLSQQLRQFGADAFIVNVLGIAVIRELGPVLAAILVAGRSGSAMTAQIGVMRVNEELDAMRVMGIAKGFRLVLPRVLATSLAMPLVSVWATLWALLGGMLAADAVMGLTPAYFANAVPGAVQVSNLTLAVSKSVVFGAAIALIACHFGLRVKPNTESLGRGTTSAVVVSITSVILVDALFAVLFQHVGIR